MHSAPVLALHCILVWVPTFASCWCVQVRNCLTLNHGWAWVTSARKASSTCFRNISSESSFMTTYYICALVALRIMVRRTLMTRSVTVVDDIMFRFVYVYECMYMYTYTTCLLAGIGRASRTSTSMFDVSVTSTARPRRARLIVSNVTHYYEAHCLILRRQSQWMGTYWWACLFTGKVHVYCLDLLRSVLVWKFCEK